MQGRREICTVYWWGNKCRRLLGILMHRLKDNIRTDLNETEWKNAE